MSAGHEWTGPAETLQGQLVGQYGDVMHDMTARDNQTDAVGRSVHENGWEGTLTARCVTTSLHGRRRTFLPFPTAGGPASYLPSPTPGCQMIVDGRSSTHLSTDTIRSITSSKERPSTTSAMALDRPRFLLEAS